MIPIRPSSSVRPPNWIVLQLLDTCNLRCPMCYEWGENGAYHARPERARLELSLARRIVDDFAAHRPHFELFGGEPMLYDGLWDLVRHIRSHNCTVAFPTNGTLLTRQHDELVDAAPNQIWVSIDGPPAVNDRQRGPGVFAHCTNGIRAVFDERRRRAAAWPRIGVNCVVTPANWPYISRLFLDSLDLEQLDAVSIELQSHATADQLDAYATLAQREFGTKRVDCARAFVHEPGAFDGIDREDLAAQLRAVRERCQSMGVEFHSQPRSLTTVDIDHYLSGRWEQMSDRRSRCAMPWSHVEVTARGEVAFCHTFHDIVLGTLSEQSLSEIWNGARAQRFRDTLRRGLLPICTACCRYYHGAAHT